MVPHQAEVPMETNQGYPHRVTTLIKPQGRKVNMSELLRTAAQDHRRSCQVRQNEMHPKEDWLSLAYGMMKTGITTQNLCQETKWAEERWHAWWPGGMETGEAWPNAAKAWKEEQKPAYSATLPPGIQRGRGASWREKCDVEWDSRLHSWTPFSSLSWLNRKDV